MNLIWVHFAFTVFHVTDENGNKLTDAGDINYIKLVIVYTQILLQLTLRKFEFSFPEIGVIPRTQLWWLNF